MVMYRSKEFCSKIKVSMKTLENLEKKGIIEPIRKGHLRYYTEEHVEKYFGIKNEKEEKNKKVIAYYRVSTNSQKKEMLNQRKTIESFSISKGIVINEYLSDIGSGMNFKRKNFLKIIDMIENKEISKLIVTYKDRLTRFAFDLIEERCKTNNVELIVINIESTSPQQELVEDLMTIIHVFSCRLYGLRKYKNKIKKDLDQEIDTDSED